MRRGLAAVLSEPPAWSAANPRGSRSPILPEPLAPRGSVHIRVERCKGCELCIEYCPTDVLALSDEFNTKGYHYPVVVSDECIVCQACSTICPDYAIFAVPAPA